MKDAIELKQEVRDKYNALARLNKSCCDDTNDCSFVGESYASLDGYVSEADLGLGCGLPTEYAGIRAGDTVVDLGSGAGNDCFIARSLTGDSGRVIGIDMAEDMLAKAYANLDKTGYRNVEFRFGEIEEIPLANDTADVVVSNCVFNLVPDKTRAFAETYRILKPGAHFSISDIVIQGTMPDALREAAELYVGCVSGALDRAEYLEIIANAGFVDIRVMKERQIVLNDDLLERFMTAEERKVFERSDIGIYSVTINATKPVVDACCDPECC
ncbi:MAG: arsenite methyltransferase [Saprospiraceae bacterium]|nr:arsenite methyltransferase [Saprospiraceae bacterium]